MPNIDLSILNQRQTPAFFADTLANRPAAGFLGRIFVSTDTYAFYRDNGMGWDLIGGPGTGTITGSGAAGQVTYFSGTSSITGSNDLFWDNVNGHFGIGTNVPGTALDVHHDQPTIAILNQTVATNDTRIGFQNNGTALWRIGNFYNAGANDWVIFDVVGAAQPFTIKKTTGQTFIGAETTTSGRLVVNNATGDNHIVVIGATAPSIRINNAGSGATRQIGIGLATTTNNFIQGTTGGEMAIFNSNTTASPILFGIYDAGLSNTQEAARISAARNFIVGGTTDVGHKLMVYGRIGFNTSGQTFTISSYQGANSAGFNIFIGGGGENSIGQIGNTILGSRNVSLGETAFFSNTEGWGNIAVGRDCLYNNTTGINNVALGYASFLSNTTGSYNTAVGVNSGRFTNSGGANQTSEYGVYIGNNARGTDASTNEITIGYNAQGGGSNTATFGNTSIIRTYLNGNTLIGTTTDAGQKLQVFGNVLFDASNTANLRLKGTAITGFDLQCDAFGAYIVNRDNTDIYFFTNNVQKMRIKNNTINMSSLPTSSSGLVSGDLWNNSGVVNIIP